MRFYHVQPDQHYFCGVDLHTKAMYLCLLDQAGHILLHKNIRTRPEAFLKAIAPYRDGLVVACERIFCWYWLADLCQREGIDFVLGHALYMRAIHGGKTKNDKLDAKTTSSTPRRSLACCAAARCPRPMPTLKRNAPRGIYCAAAVTSSGCAPTCWPTSN